jgi:hypothetical protein
LLHLSIILHWSVCRVVRWFTYNDEPPTLRRCTYDDECIVNIIFVVCCWWWWQCYYILLWGDRNIRRWVATSKQIQNKQCTHLPPECNDDDDGIILVLRRWRQWRSRRYVVVDTTIFELCSRWNMRRVDGWINYLLRWVVYF